MGLLRHHRPPLLRPKPVPLAPKRCQTCRLWAPPAWETVPPGFGRCDLPTECREAKPPILVPLRANPGGWVGTHATFGCCFHQEKT